MFSMSTVTFAKVKMRLFIGMTCCVAACSLSIGTVAYVLRFEIDGMLFPRTINADTGAAETFRVYGTGQNELMVRRYGSSQYGCVVFFPGQHGNEPKYERTLFPFYLAEGISVFAVAYPGQDGASGRGTTDEVRSLVQQALLIVARTCSVEKTVLVGRSLGSMIAAYASRDTAVAGLVLEGASPTLSAAIRMHLRSKSWLAPLSQLPISSLLSTDYSLGDALSHRPNVPVIVIQGDQDILAPIAALKENGALPADAHFIEVHGGTHSNAYIVAPRAHVESVLEILRRRQS